MRLPWPLARPPRTFGKIGPRGGGEGGWLARDPDQPIWVTLTWPRGPDALPTPPARPGREGLGATPPPPTQPQFPGGGDTPDYILPPHQAKGNSGAPLEGSGIQVLHCGGRLIPENNHRRRPVATPRRADPGYAHAAPSNPAGLANGGTTNGTTCPSLAVASRTGLGRLERLCWKGRQGEGAAPLPTSLFPWSCRTTAQPIGSEMWRVAASLGVYAALFCLVTDALEMRFMTSSLPPTNRKRSRGEVFLPLRLCFFTRVSERARAKGVGEIASTVARMSGEAPPPCLYIKGWRGARRRHFALEWSSL